MKEGCGCEWGGWCANSVTSPYGYGAGLWKTIRQGWPTFTHYIQYEVGDGSRVKCCQNLWCGGEHSKDAFSRVIQDQPG